MGMRLARTLTRASWAPVVEIEVLNGEPPQSPPASLCDATAHTDSPLQRQRSPLDPYGSAQPSAASAQPSAHARAASSAPGELQRAVPGSPRSSVEAVLPTITVSFSRLRTLVADGRRDAGGHAPLAARTKQRGRESAPRSLAFSSSGGRGRRRSDSEVGDGLARCFIGSGML